MDKSITYHWAEDHVRIDLGNRTEPRIRLLFWTELLITSGLATVFLLQAFTAQKSWSHWCTMTGAGLLYFLATMRFLGRIYFKEQLVITEQHLVLMERTFFTRKIRQYDWKSVGPLHYLGKDRKTDHPLKGRHFDYFGFETHEHVIQSLHQEGNLYFNYQGFPVRFGRCLYSWDAEEVVCMMKLFLGDTIQLGAEWERMMQEQEWNDARQ